MDASNLTAASLMRCIQSLPQPINPFVELACRYGADLDDGDLLIVSGEIMRRLPELEAWRDTPGVKVTEFVPSLTMYVLHGRRVMAQAEAKFATAADKAIKRLLRRASGS